MGAAVCAGVVSYLLLLGALLSDRGKRSLTPDNLLLTPSKFFSIDQHSDSDEWKLSSHLLYSLKTDALERKESLFTLVNDKEWRIAAATRSKRKRRSISDKNDKELAESDLDCEAISKMVPSMNFLAAGWTKAVYKAKTGDNRTVAVKTVDLTGQDMSRCLEERRRQKTNGDDVEWCYQRAARKLIKEIAVLKLLLEHPNVVKVRFIRLSRDHTGTRGVLVGPRLLRPKEDRLEIA